jgi:RNA polymerase sigma-70 factor (ECF subfamily)
MQSGAGFQSTQWSLVLAAHDDPRHLDALLRGYVAPIYAYVRRAGHPREDAADLTQEFIASVLLGRGLIDRADPSRGRFRTFVKAALANFLVDQHRRVTAKARRPATPLIRGLRLEDVEPAEQDDPAVAFDRQWAATVLALALDRVESDCAACGQRAHWAAFSAAVLDPVLRYASPPPLDELARTVGAQDAAQVSSQIQTVRRKFRRTLRQVIGETLADPAHADDELQSLTRFLRL